MHGLDLTVGDWVCVCIDQQGAQRYKIPASARASLVGSWRARVIKIAADGTLVGVKSEERGSWMIQRRDVYAEWSAARTSGAGSGATATATAVGRGAPPPPSALPPALPFDESWPPAYSSVVPQRASPMGVRPRPVTRGCRTRRTRHPSAPVPWPSRGEAAWPRG